MNRKHPYVGHEVLVRGQPGVVAHVEANGLVTVLVTEGCPGGEHVCVHIGQLVMKDPEGAAELLSADCGEVLE